MNEKQVELVNLITNDMGETVIQIGKGNDARFFVGTIETPFGDQNFVVVIGKEITRFFGESTMMKTAVQVKLDLTTFMANTSPILIKCSANSDWWSYGRI